MSSSAMAVGFFTDISTTTTSSSELLTALNSSTSGYDVYRREFIPLRSNAVPGNLSWLGVECQACKGWIQGHHNTVKEKPQLGINLTILPLSALLLLLLGLCANVVNWFHTDVRMSKHKEYLSPQFQHRRTNLSTDGVTQPAHKPPTAFRRHSRVSPGEENLLLASSNSSSYTSVFNSSEPHLLPPENPPAAAKLAKMDRASLRRSPNARPRLCSGARSRTADRKVLNNLDSNTVPVVMYLDKTKIQRQVLKQIERQDSRSRLLSTMSHSDLTRKQSNASSGYTSSAPDSRTDSQQDISNTTSISELCSDKVDSPIRVISPQNCDNLIIGNLISKSSFLLNIPTAMSPKPARYSASPNGYIEDCFIFPGSSQGSSLDRFGPVSPVISDAPSSSVCDPGGCSSGCQSMTQSMCQNLSPDEDPMLASSSVDTVKRSSHLFPHPPDIVDCERVVEQNNNNSGAAAASGGRRWRKAYRARPSVSFEDETLTDQSTEPHTPSKEYYRLATLSKSYEGKSEASLATDSMTSSFIEGQDSMANSISSPSNKCIWVIGENFDSDSVKDEDNGKVEYYV